jgi:hypothetical protein
MPEPVLALLEEFAVRRARGERPDPLLYLERAGDEADALAAMIEGLVASVPPPEPAPEVVERMRALVAGEPELLGLRLGRRMRVDEVVAGLVERLGLDRARAPKVRRLYQRLEGGLLDASRIEARLADALARVLGVPRSDLPLTGPPPAAPAMPDLLLARSDWAGSEVIASAPAPYLADEPDEIDRLFGAA